jgi:hypothetical protein
LEEWSHGGGKAGAAAQGGAVVARRGGGGLVAFVRKRKKTRVAWWAAWAERAMKPVGWGGGLGGLGQPTGQGRVRVVAGPADMGRAEVADFLGVRICEGKAVLQKYASRMGGSNRTGRHRHTVGWAETASWADREAEAQWGEGERPVEEKQVGRGWADWAESEGKFFSE